ncbi:MAG: DUF6497 family protein [Pseudomonadota bacterium]|uniref:DUF6497 family protein n=1 Tax=Roseovarius TaxID=74030 RepID=UPI0022A84C8F|nr:DUF6497 family protein [Roseovarius sp. EGI FJ00037]MCZ0812095.1 DUF6497 family protein [Roseovarius sp. EGI FJ00037]
MRPLGIHIPAAALTLALVAGAAAGEADKAKEERLVLPSGLEATFHEMLWDRPGQGLTYRFRFVVPGFTGEEEFETIMADLEHLCTTYAVPRLSPIGPEPAQVIISVADRESVFGVIDPEVKQVFEAYRIENGTCIWEVF